MTTFLDVRNRVADQLARSDLSAQIDRDLSELLRQVEAERDGWPLECVAAPGADGRS